MKRRPMTSRGFTLIELLVVITIIALLISIGLVALSGAMRSAGSAADTGAMRSIRMALTTFEQDNGFRVPLVFDGDPLKVDGPAVVSSFGISPSPGGVPIYENGNINPPIKFVAVYSVGKERDFFRGGEDDSGKDVLSVDNPSSGLSDARYSKFSLPIYLAGILPAEIDGRDGPNLSKPASDGSFLGTKRRGTAATYESYIPYGENDAFAPRSLYGDSSLAQSEVREIAEHGGTKPGDSLKYSNSMLDRYGTPYRYYRWEPGRSTAGVANYSGDEGEISSPADLNIPGVLQDMVEYQLQVAGDENVDGVSGNAKLRSARWAIVSAGSDGLFGTEAPVDLGVSGTNAAETLEARVQAMKDNVVEVGS